MGNLSAKFGNLGVLILGSTPAGKEIRYKSKHKINETSPDHMCLEWAGSGRTHFYKIKLIAAIQGKSGLQHDSVPGTTYCIEKAQSVVIFFDTIKSYDCKVYRGVT